MGPSGNSDLCGTVAGMVTPVGSMSTEGETLQVSVLPYRCSICPPLVSPDKSFSHMLNSLGRWPQLACLFHSAQAATLLEFHIPLMNCSVCRWFCVVHGLKPPLNDMNYPVFFIARQSIAEQAASLATIQQVLCFKNTLCVVTVLQAYQIHYKMFFFPLLMIISVLNFPC
jgi:hypothetical protein